MRAATGSTRGTRMRIVAGDPLLAPPALSPAWPPMRRTVANLLGRHFWALALAMMAAGFWLPGDFTGVKPFVPVFLGGILYFTALKVRAGDVLLELRGGRRLARLGVLAAVKLLVLPLAAWTVAQAVAPEWALGVLLVMAMPAGLSSTAASDVYRANVPFALVVTFTTSALAPLTVPLLLQWLGPPSSGIAMGVIAERALYILLLLATPFTLAQLTRRVAPAFVARHHHRWSYGAILSSCLLIFVAIAGNRAAWAHLPQASLLMPLALDTVAIALAFAGGLAARRWTTPADGSAFGFCCIWMNNGLGVAFATRFFPGDTVVLGPVLIQLPVIAGVALLGWWTLRSAHAPPAGDDPGADGTAAA